MKRSAKNKLAAQEQREIKPKFQQQRAEQLANKPLIPLTEKQKYLIEEIKSKNLVVAMGYAGTGRTFVAASVAAEMYHLGQIDKIILARPAISEAASVGFFSGSKDDKMLNWVAPMIDVLNKRLGKTVVDLAISEGNIELQPLETIKGRSFGKDTFVICDEAQDATIEEIKSVVTRNANCKMVICGDVRQSALKKNSGLYLLLDILDKSPELDEYIGFIDFDEYDDIVRSKICKQMIIAFERAGF